MAKSLRLLTCAAFALLLSACGGSAAPSSPSSTPSPMPTIGPTPNAASVPSAPGASTIIFSGYTWSVRSSTGGPGPNTFTANNVWVDANGFLHLRIAQTNGAWSTAEVVSSQAFGFGAYQFQLMGHPEAMDPNAVLGFFTYPPAAVGPDGTNEIDIEFSTWGGAQSEHGNWTVWPASSALAGQQTTQPFDASANSGVSTHRFAWRSTSVAFADMSGLTDGTTGEYANWTFAPSNSTQLIPQQPGPVHMNLWLYQGAPPVNGQGVEMVVTGFSYTP